MDFSKMTPEQMQAKLVELQAEKNALEQAALSGVSFKVSPRTGIVCIYGTKGGSRPVSIYAEQWERLYGNADRLNAFVEAERAKGSLRIKGESVEDYQKRTGYVDPDADATQNGTPVRTAA